MTEQCPPKPSFYAWPKCTTAIINALLYYARKQCAMNKYFEKGPEPEFSRVMQEGSSGSDFSVNKFYHMNSYEKILKTKISWSLFFFWWISENYLRYFFGDLLGLNSFFLVCSSIFEFLSFELMNALPFLSCDLSSDTLNLLPIIRPTFLWFLQTIFFFILTKKIFSSLCNVHL